jgi:hypothetical protein
LLIESVVVDGLAHFNEILLENGFVGANYRLAIVAGGDADRIRMIEMTTAARLA